MPSLARTAAEAGTSLLPRRSLTVPSARELLGGAHEGYSDADIERILDILYAFAANVYERQRLGS